MICKSRSYLSKSIILAGLTLLLLQGLSQAGTVLGTSLLQHEQHALDNGPEQPQADSGKQTIANCFTPAPSLFQ
jgi:hypothetical protein